jgi:hypothetical protein
MAIQIHDTPDIAILSGDLPNKCSAAGIDNVGWGLKTVLDFSSNIRYMLTEFNNTARSEGISLKLIDKKNTPLITTQANTQITDSA